MINLYGIGWSNVDIWAGLGPKFMAAQYVGLKTQEYQRSMFAIYIGRNQNSINIIPKRAHSKKDTFQKGHIPKKTHSTLVAQPMLQLQPNQTELRLMVSKSIFNVDSKNVSESSSTVTPQKMLFFFKTYLGGPKEKI